MAIDLELRCFFIQNFPWSVSSKCVVVVTTRLLKLLLYIFDLHLTADFNFSGRKLVLFLGVIFHLEVDNSTSAAPRTRMLVRYSLLI